MEDCRKCGKVTFVTGTLEGVSFEPESEHHKFLSKGIYGITCTVCMNCGRIDTLALDPEVLRKHVKKV